MSPRTITTTERTGEGTAERVTDHPATADITLQGVLEALADPVRRTIVRGLVHAPGHIACGSFDLSVTRSTRTHHFKVLRQAGVIRQHYVGTSRLSELRAEELERLFPGLLSAVVGASSATESTETAETTEIAVR
ncbi:ArsR/SmtB family transcription factor [Streptomyces sp. NPDC087440]|uniref:ArsR/SmtB family transcription factor n=1 Tax=Streptomyces sp. NPDC087440 TaxID=3365790 RepID=UPI00381D56EF